jgi:serine O-acetyltransferase
MKKKDKIISESRSVAHSNNGRGLITEVVRELAARHEKVKPFWKVKPSCHLAPSKAKIADITEEIRSVLFPGYHWNEDFTSETVSFYLGSALTRIQRDLTDQIRRGLCFACKDDLGICMESECISNARIISAKFIERLPSVQKLLETDVQAAYEGDPAANSIEETIFCYPGVLAVTNYRIAHELHLLGVPLIPRIITEHAHSLTGIDIHPGARIGSHFFIDHGTGVVIGETTIIGNRVRLYQGVTLGAKSFPLDPDGNPIKGIDRHPIVEDDVVIYAGATILGRVRIGHDSVIAGNVWLMQDIPPHSKIAQKSGRVLGLPEISASAIND